MDAQLASPRLCGTKSEDCDRSARMSKSLGSDEDRAAVVAFDGDRHDNHQRQREGNEHTREHEPPVMATN